MEKVSSFKPGYVQKRHKNYDARTVCSMCIAVRIYVNRLPSFVHDPLVQNYGRYTLYCTYMYKHIKML